MHEDNGESGGKAGGRRRGEIIPSHSNRRTDDAVREALHCSRAPLAVRPIVMDFRHENMLISVRTEGAERQPAWQ